MDLSIIKNGSTLIATYTSTTYQWLDCGNNYSKIPGDTSRQFTPAKSSNYAVELSLSSCSDTSKCGSVIITKISEFKNENDLIILKPNPAKDLIIIKNYNEYENIEAKIYSIKGQFEKSITLKGSNPIINISDLAEGLHILQIEQKKFKFIKLNH